MLTRLRGVSSEPFAVLGLGCLWGASTLRWDRRVMGVWAPSCVGGGTLLNSMLGCLWKETIRQKYGSPAPQCLQPPRKPSPTVRMTRLRGWQAEVPLPWVTQPEAGPRCCSVSGPETVLSVASAWLPVFASLRNTWFYHHHN